MNKLELLNENFIQARKDKNEIAKALFSSFRGEYDTAVKKGSSPGDSTIEKIAKKMTENAKEVGTPEALQEIELLKPFMPVMLDENKIREIVVEVVKINPNKLTNKGFITGMVMKQSAGKADINIVNKIIEEEILKCEIK